MKVTIIDIGPEEEEEIIIKCNFLDDEIVKLINQVRQGSGKLTVYRNGGMFFLEPEEVEEGDVIAFHSAGAVISHRVVRHRVVEGEFVTKGDANAAADMNTVLYEELIGRVKYHIPVLGSLMALWTSTLGKLYALCVAACGVMLNMLASRLREREEEA